MDLKEPPLRTRYLRKQNILYFINNQSFDLPLSPRNSSLYNLVISSPRSDPERSSEADMVLVVEAAATTPAAELVLDPEEMPVEEEDLTLVLGSLWSFFHFILRF